MEFSIRASSGWYSDALREYNNLAHRYPCLLDLGLRLETKINEYKPGVYIHIDNMEDLMTLIKRVGHGVCVFDDPPTIEIYDDWRE